MKLTAIILTHNEQRHLGRCLASLEGVVDQVVVVDCLSNDETIALAQAAGAKVLKRAWVSYANQFNWALSRLGDDVDGVICDRRLVFQGRRIRYGGVFPVPALRLFRYGRGECENRWINEQIRVRGATTRFEGELIDEKLESLTDWVAKHNRYASREAVDLLNREFHFMPPDSEGAMAVGAGESAPWLKQKVYFRLPGGFRAFLFFFYRYFLRLGFLDGKAGTVFHFLQGFWYRYLVDAKIEEVRRCMKREACDIETAIDRVLNIRVWRLRNAAAER